MKKFFEKMILIIALFYFLFSTIMFFYSKLPQIESGVDILNSKYITISKPNQIYQNYLEVPVFDSTCKYSEVTAIEALVQNGVKKENIIIKDYFEKGIFNPVSIDYRDFKCWDRIVGSTFSQGTILGEDQKITLYYNAYPAIPNLICSIIFLALALRIQNKFIPFKFLSDNFHLVLLATTLIQFFIFLKYIDGYSKIFNDTNYLLIMFSISYLLYTFIIKGNNLVFIPSVLLILISFFILIYNNISINAIFTDLDVYQSQLPISYFQFEQIKTYGKLFSWNSNLGAGYQLAGQYASDSLIRQILFSVSPNFNFATNLYFFINIVVGVYFFALFLKEVGFSNYVSLLGSFIFYTSNQTIAWSTFLHYPAFLSSFSLLIFGIIISKKRPFYSKCLIIGSFYIISTGGHLQNLFFLSIFSFLIVVTIYFIKDLNEKILFKPTIFTIAIGSLMSIYIISPFFELITNVGSRTSSDETIYLTLSSFSNFFNNKFLRESCNLICGQSINDQLFVSTLLIFIFLLIKSDFKYIKQFSISLFISFCLLGFKNPINDFLIVVIPGLDFVSNWQRVAPFLIFSVILIILPKLEAFLTKNNKKLVMSVILFSVVLSALTRVNAFYNTEMMGTRYTDLYLNIQEINNKLTDIDLTANNSRILSICNLSDSTPVVADVNLILESNLYWAGLYESFPNKYYNQRFLSIVEASSIIKDDVGGRIYTHKEGDKINTSNLDQLNIEYLISFKSWEEGKCDFDKTNLTKVFNKEELTIFRVNDFEPIIHQGYINGQYVIPNNINRVNPEYIEINLNNSNSEYLFFNETYSMYWDAVVDEKQVEIINNRGFMSIKIKGQNKEVLLKFNNKDFYKNITSIKNYFYK